MTVNKMTSEVEGSRETKSPLVWERVAMFHKQPEKVCPGAQGLFSAVTCINVPLAKASPAWGGLCWGIKIDPPPDGRGCKISEPFFFFFFINLSSHQEHTACFLVRVEGGNKPLSLFGFASN